MANRPLQPHFLVFFPGRLGSSFLRRAKGFPPFLSFSNFSTASVRAVQCNLGYAQSFCGSKKTALRRRSNNPSKSDNRLQSIRVLRHDSVAPTGGEQTGYPEISWTCHSGLVVNDTFTATPGGDTLDIATASFFILDTTARHPTSGDDFGSVEYLTIRILKRGERGLPLSSVRRCSSVGWVSVLVMGRQPWTTRQYDDLDDTTTSTGSEPSCFSKNWRTWRSRFRQPSNIITGCTANFV